VAMEEDPAVLERAPAVDEDNKDPFLPVEL
jgi:hypothetical protein